MERDRTLTVCHIASGDLWAGAEVQVFNMVSSLHRKTDIEVFAITLNEGTLASNLRDTGVEVAVIDESSFSFPVILKKAASMLSPRKVDILHTHRYKENLLGTRLKKSCHIPFLVQTVHGMPEAFTGFDRVKITLYRMVNEFITARFFDRVIAVSEDIRSALSRRIRRQKLAVIYNSVDIAAIKSSRSAHDVRAELGIPANHALIGSAGRMVPVKGYDIFIRAAEKIRKENPDVHFVLIGDGAERPALEHQAQSRGLEDSLIFTGFRRDIHDLLGSLDVFVISSFHEGIPVVLLEAMALGRPIVTTAVGGVPEVVSDGVSARLVPPGDPSLLADSIMQLLADRTIGAELAAGAQKTVAERFSTEAQATRLVETYRQLGEQK
jgi:glycosyltransferase involved in cell wall biosynthesis